MLDKSLYLILPFLILVDVNCFQYFVNLRSDTLVLSDFCFIFREKNVQIHNTILGLFYFMLWVFLKCSYFTVLETINFRVAASLSQQKNVYQFFVYGKMVLNYCII